MQEEIEEQVEKPDVKSDQDVSYDPEVTSENERLAGLFNKLDEARLGMGLASGLFVGGEAMLSGGAHWLQVVGVSVMTTAATKFIDEWQDHRKSVQQLKNQKAEDK